MRAKSKCMSVKYALQTWKIKAQIRNIRTVSVNQNSLSDQKQKRPYVKTY